MPNFTRYSQGSKPANESATSISAADIPVIGEEYLRAYHLTSLENAISSIALGRLKVSRFSDLNDPFELMAVSHRDSRVRRAVGKNKKEIDETTGLLCFSENWKEPVLWSHYGARHRGVCLGFDIKSSITEKVQYEDARLLDELDKNPDPEKLPKNLKDQLRITKYKHWKYEREIRIFVPLADASKEGEQYFVHFNNDLRLVDVILGPLCSASLDGMRKLVSERNSGAKTCKARLAQKSFEVVRDTSTVI